MGASCDAGKHQGSSGTMEVAGVAGVAGTPHSIFSSLMTMRSMSCHRTLEAEEGKKH
jgi:hypothetical protein